MDVYTTTGDQTWLHVQEYAAPTDIPEATTRKRLNELLAGAREVFEVRRALEAEVVRLVIKRWKPAMGAELEGLVREEDAARDRHEEKVWGRLAGEFHIHLARLSGNRLLERYMAELVTRCSLILAVFGKPHTADHGVNEHAEIIAALRAGDADRAVAIMDHHMGAVERRAVAREQRPDVPTDALVGPRTGA